MNVTKVSWSDIVHGIHMETPQISQKRGSGQEACLLASAAIAQLDPTSLRARPSSLPAMAAERTIDDILNACERSVIFQSHTYGIHVLIAFVSCRLAGYAACFVNLLSSLIKIVWHWQVLLDQSRLRSQRCGEFIYSAYELL